MFATQLNGLFNRIHEKQSDEIEDGARLLAQAAVTNGSIYIYGIKEMFAVASEAVSGAEPLSHAAAWNPENGVDIISNADRVLLITRYANDVEAVQFARLLTDNGIPFVVLSTHLDTNEETLVDLADVHIDLQLNKGLLPNEAGERYGYPSAMAALFIYYGLKFTIDEILTEYE